MFKNTRLSAVLAAVLFSVTAAVALVSAPAFADAPKAATETAAPAAAAPAAADAAAPAAATHAGKEEVENPFGIKAVWEGGFVPRATIIILSLMSMGSWYIIITKLLDQMKIMKQAKETSAKFWKANSIAAGSAMLKEGSPFRQAVAWTASNISRYGGDPNKLFLMGHSAGAYNAAMLALDARYLGQQGMAIRSLAGWIGLAGPYDFMPIENKTVRPVFHFPNTPRQSQPINHTGGAMLPALLIAASKDKLVNPVRNTGGLAAKLRAAGVPVEEVYYDGVSHTTLLASISAPLRSLAPTLDAIDAFIKGTSTAPR